MHICFSSVNENHTDNSKHSLQLCIQCYESVLFFCYSFLCYSWFCSNQCFVITQYLLTFYMMIVWLVVSTVASFFYIILVQCLVVKNAIIVLLLFYTVSQKTVQICSCQSFVKFPPILIIFGKKISNRLQLCEMYSFSKIVLEFMYELPKYRMFKKCLVYGLSALHRKCDAALRLHRKEYVTVQVLKELKCALVCYVQGRIFNPTNLLNHVAPSIELVKQMWAI